MCDGDEFIGSDPQLMELLTGEVARAFNLMRGTEDEAKRHDAEVRAAMEPFFRAVFAKMAQIKAGKLVFVYVCWRQWIVDVFREYFPTSLIVDVQVTRSLLLERFVNREAKEYEKEGKSHETLWRDDQGARFKLCRERYGPEWKGNEENYRKLIEWRFYVYREPFWEGENCYVVDNDNFKGAQQVEKILNLTAS